MNGGRCLVLLGAIAVAGCGAKTGLDAPVSMPDAGVAAVPEVTRCVALPSGGRVVAEFSLPVTLAVVDVMFLIDATASMVDEIDNVRERLRDVVVPGVRAAIPDAQFGLALAGEFPIEEHGPPDVAPFDMRVPITADVLRVEAALDAIPSWGNYDDPEAQVEALYQIATGAGLPPFIDPFLGCPGGGIGGACFRREALSVIVLITDAPFHNGPPGVDPIAPYRFEPAPHRYEDAIAALDDLDALVIGLGARDFGAMSPIAHLRALARDTRAVDAMLTPLVLDIGDDGSRVGGAIVDAIEHLAADVPLDVDAILEDIPGDPYDVRDLVVEMRPTSASPGRGVREITDRGFLGVVPGTQVRYGITIDAASLAADAPLRVPGRVVFRAFGRTRLGAQDVVFVIGDDCEEEES